MADAPQPPPNLRVSDSEVRECGSCKYYQHGRCTHADYNMLPVVDEWVCDSWAKGSQTDTDADDQPEPKNLREATVRVREHFRRLRAQQ